MTFPIIVLEQKHLNFCQMLGTARQNNALKLGCAQVNNVPFNADGLHMHIAGAQGECACYLYLRPVRWNKFPGTFAHSADFEDWIDVKSRAQSHHRLIVQRTSIPQWAYVLACLADLPRVKLIGWCWGLEAMHMRNWSDPVNGRPAYFVSADDPVIKPMYALRDLLRQRQQEVQP